MLVYFLNIAVAIAFLDEIMSVANAAYAALRIPTLPADFWEGRLWLGFIVVVVTVDFCDYAIHRLMHTKWLWPTHAAHHSDTHVNAFSSFRVHFFEPVLMMLTYMILLTWLQLPDLLPWIALIFKLHNMYVHMDLDWGHGPLKYLIASPRFHRWHHADVPEAHGKNLANVIPLFDVIFGTYRVPGPCREPMGALKSGIEDKNPILIWIYPFQAWARMIRRSFRRGREGQAGSRMQLPPAE